jgi:hypothetical protein
MTDESSGEPEKYGALRRRLKSRRRDDFALDLFRQAEASLLDIPAVARILLELGRCYNPLTNGPIVDVGTRRRILELVQAGREEEARELLDERLAAYGTPSAPPQESETSVPNRDRPPSPRREESGADEVLKDPGSP